MQTEEIMKQEKKIEKASLHNEKVRARGFDNRKTIIIGILIVTMLLSIFVAPFAVDKLHIIDEAEKILDSKKDTVVAVTATAATLSVAVAAIPGDSTTPLANQIAELDVFFIIVLIAIYLLKILLVVSTLLSFKLLFPSACLLFAIYYLSNNDYLKNLAVKILILGLVVFLTVPISVGTMNVVDATLRTQEKVETIAIEDEPENSVETEEKNEDKKWWKNIIDNITDRVKDVTDKVVKVTEETLQKVKNKFGELVDIVASLIITCCVIPLLVIVFLVWILKMLFGINISTKSGYRMLHNKMSKAFIKRTKNIDCEENAEI